jgi:hypothetical protein
MDRIIGNPVAIELLIAESHRFSDYDYGYDSDSDSDSDKDNDCLRCST